jgi:allantoicase
VSATDSGDFTDLVNLADERLGAAVVACTDEYFAPADSLLNSGAPEYRTGEYTERGKWMDGWETRRRRDLGLGDEADWCIVRLGAPGVVRGVVVDTAYFTGNFPEACWVEGCAAEGYPAPDELAAADVAWSAIVPRATLKGDTEHRFVSSSAQRFTHVRLWIAPDGGVARFRVYGEVVPDPRAFAGMPLDLAAVENGGVVESCSDMYFSSRHNLAMPGPPRSMADGWETRRLRGQGHDWAILRLAAEGTVRVAEVDTRFFKGNAPSGFSLDRRTVDDERWQPLIGQTRLQPNTRHRFFVPAHPPAVRVRINVYPDGGLARLRLFGTLSDRGREALALRRVNALPDARAEGELLGVCGSRR